MKSTVAEFKRRMRVGSNWIFSSHWCQEPVTRTCTHSQSNSFALTHPTKEGSSWCDWPRATQVDVTLEDDCLNVEIDMGNGFTLFYREEK